MRKFFLLGAAVLLATSFSANQAEANVGVGYLYSSHPVGLFFDLDGSYVHIGVGFDRNDVPANSGALETTIGAAGAWVMDMWDGDSWGFGPTIGATFDNMSFEGGGDSASMFHISVGFKGHWEPASNVSFWFGHGVNIDISSPPVGDSTTDFSTGGFNIADLGFTVWID